MSNNPNTNRTFALVIAGLAAMMFTLVYFALVSVGPANAAAKVYAGPYEATVVRHVDADTVVLQVDLWPGQTVITSVRINKIDTPETFRPKCDAERAFAKEASAYVRSIAPLKASVKLRDVFLGKFAGRVVGTVEFETVTGTDTIADALIRRRFAKPYFGKGARPDWCGDPASGG